MKTIGDQRLDVALSKIGEKSLFTKELEFALMEKEVAFVVHSCKDLPTTLPPGMKIAAIMEREDPRDAVVMSKQMVAEGKVFLSQLPKGATIGSSSLRRQAQLRHRYPHLNIESVRGNLNTRLRKLDGEHETCQIEYSAIILAAAGLNRMVTQNEAFKGRLSSHLESSECMYAVSQGALAIEILEGDEQTAQLLQCLHHSKTALTITAERAFMKTLDGGCSSPIAVQCDLHEDKERGFLIAMSSLSIILHLLLKTHESSCFAEAFSALMDPSACIRRARSTCLLSRQMLNTKVILF